MKQPIARILGMALFPLMLAGNFLEAADDRFAVHEWGTFTSLQDEEGNTLGGINTDDEPVPRFVHNISGTLLIHPRVNAPRGLSKEIAVCHRDVTMRLETPVLYVYAPDGFRGTVGFKVEFRGGWLTQFFPRADVGAPGVDPKTGIAGRLPADTVGWLHWPKVSLVGEDRKGPETKDRVWLAPREVKARMLGIPGGESERFLFYRGVGNLDAPLRVVRHEADRSLKINPASVAGRSIRKLWLVDIRSNGTGAFRVVEPRSPSLDAAPLAETRDSFLPQDYSAAAIVGLRSAMKTALVEEGLFDDEAEALLNTWEVSYFKSAGMRLFFLTPLEWTNEVLPLTITGLPKQTEVTRVMVGRIELVSPHQREVIRKIAAIPNPRASGVWDPVMDEFTGLGRFARPLILDELQRRPTEALKVFVGAFGLGGYPQEP